MKFKKWCKLENGQIEPCYYSNGDVRNINYEDGRYYLIHDVYAHNMILTMCHKIVKFADTAEELM